MKREIRFFVLTILVSVAAISSYAQGKVNEERMQRDIEVAENILSTVIKQQFDKRSFFPMEVRGEYREGYGVTFHLPWEVDGPMVWGVGNSFGGVTMLDGDSFSYSFDIPDGEDIEVAQILDGNQQVKTETIRGKARAPKSGAASRRINSDSMRTASSNLVIAACKEFLANYGDLMSQLPANERIIITNRGEGERVWIGAFVNASKPSYLSVEANKSDIVSYKQGKLTLDQFNNKVKVVNSVMDDELQPDLELLTSIFNRLYRQDLSKTFFTEENLYYERLKDYGVIYYMEVYSSNANSGQGFPRNQEMRYSMPTIGEQGLSQSERDKRVVEMYPRFEKDIKEDMLEYGRTLKSLKPEEALIFNVKMTRCEGCGIPSSLELSVKAEVLKDYASGKISKEAALGKLTIKKGSAQ